MIERGNIWRCNGKYVEKGKKGCDSRHIDDGVLEQAFVDVFNAIVENKDYFIGKWHGMLESDNALVRYKVKQFIEIIAGARPLADFDLDLYFAITEKIVVYGEGRLMVVLLDGTAVECEMK